MSLELVTAGLQEKVGEDCGLGATLKFDFGDDAEDVETESEETDVLNSRR